MLSALLHPHRYLNAASPHSKSAANGGRVSPNLFAPAGSERQTPRRLCALSLPSVPSWGHRATWGAPGLAFLGVGARVLSAQANLANRLHILLSSTPIPKKRASLRRSANCSKRSCRAMHGCTVRL